MAARRGASQETALSSEKNGTQSSGFSEVAPAVPASVIYKLLGFTLAMIVVPIGTYFVTVDTVFKGKATWAGASAAFMANVVLIGYVIVAMKEDQSERLEAEEKAKKSQ